MSSPPPLSPPAHLEEQLVQILDVIQEIQALHLALAERGDPGGPQEQALLAQMAERERRAKPLGMALIRHLSAGGALEILEGDEEPDQEESEELEDQTEETLEGQAEDPSPEPSVQEPEPSPPSPPALLDPADEATQELPKPAPWSAPPASSAELRALSQGGLKPKWSRRSPPSVELRRRELQSILRDIGKPVRPKTLTQISETVASLQENVAKMDRWLSHPMQAQQALLGVVSSMARHLQDESKQPLKVDDMRVLGTLFSQLSRWSKIHQPGYVTGLSRHNSPDAQSWLMEARAWWEELQKQINPEQDPAQTRHDLLADLEVELEASPDARKVIRLVTQTVKSGVTQSDARLISLLLPFAEDLQGAKGLKTLKGKLKEALADDPEEAESQSCTRLGSDWPYLHLTQGKHAVIIGGDPRAQAKRRIEETFGLATLQWEDTDPQRVRSLCTRVEQGSVDLVIIVRSFISHKTIDGLMPACKANGVPAAVVDKGYGTTQVRLAIERYGQKESGEG